MRFHADLLLASIQIEPRNIYRFTDLNAAEKKYKCLQTFDFNGCDDFLFLCVCVYVVATYALSTSLATSISSRFPCAHSFPDKPHEYMATIKACIYIERSRGEENTFGYLVGNNFARKERSAAAHSIYTCALPGLAAQLFPRAKTAGKKNMYLMY